MHKTDCTVCILHPTSEHLQGITLLSAFNRMVTSVEFIASWSLRIRISFSKSGQFGSYHSRVRPPSSSVYPPAMYPAYRSLSVFMPPRRCGIQSWEIKLTTGWANTEPRRYASANQRWAWAGRTESGSHTSLLLIEVPPFLPPSHQSEQQGFKFCSSPLKERRKSSQRTRLSSPLLIVLVWPIICSKTQVRGYTGMCPLMCFMPKIHT